MSLAVSVVLPCYDEGPTLRAGLERILETLRRMGDPFEMIVIDDASHDDTPEVIRRFGEEADAPVTVLAHGDNRGRGATVQEGLAVARGEVAGYLDVDLEVGPEYIPRFVSAIRAGADVATGRRHYRARARDLHRVVLSRGYAWLVRRSLDLPFCDTEAGYKFFSASAAHALVAQTSDPGWFWDTEVLATAWRKELHVVEIPCLFVRRRDKRSTVRPVADTIAYARALRRFRRR